MTKRLDITYLYCNYLYSAWEAEYKDKMSSGLLLFIHKFPNEKKYSPYIKGQ